MKYRIETTGITCHYQISNLQDIEVNDIEFGEMYYSEIEETFLFDKTIFENRKLSCDHEIKFKIYDEDNNTILEFGSNEIEQNEHGVSFCPEPEYNNDFKNALCFFDMWKGGGPIYEFETNDKLTVDSFSCSLLNFEGEEDELCFLDDVWFLNKKIENTDFGESFGKSRWMRIYKNDGSNFIVNEQD